MDRSFYTKTGLKLLSTLNDGAVCLGQGDEDNIFSLAGEKKRIQILLP
jgi:hypothetical protein